MKNYIISCLGALIIGLAIYGFAQNPPPFDTYTVNNHTSTQAESTDRIPVPPHNEVPPMPMPSPNLKSPELPTAPMPNVLPKSDIPPVEKMPIIPFKSPQAR